MSEDIKSILTLTMNPAIDAGSSVPNVFPEHKLRCGEVSHEPGGGGINVSRAIRKLGGESLALHFCGGPTGDMLRALLDREGINHHPIAVAGWTRENVTILEAATGQQYRFVMPGPDFGEKEWRSALEHVTGMTPFPDIVVASGSLPPGVPDDFYGQIARVVRAKGGRLILDTSGPALSAAVAEGVYLVKPSLRELCAFSGSELEHELDQERAAMQIVESGHCEVIVVSLGAGGVFFASRKEHGRMRSPSVPVISKVGAGDSMVAGMTLALARGLCLREAVRFGVAAGAAAVMSSGTQLCGREDTERLFQKLSSNHVDMNHLGS